MAANAPRVNTFGTFLDALNKNEQEASSEASIPRVVIQYLIEKPEPVAISKLITDMKVSVVGLGNAIETLQKAKLIELASVGGTEYLSLTDVGKGVAQLKIDPS